MISDTHSGDNSVMSLRKEIDKFLKHWHNTYVLDYWWRKKYNVPFGSPQHKAMNPIDMLIEWQEEKMIKRMTTKKEVEENVDDINGISMSQKEIDADYENIDLENFKL